jgi:transcriptional regulator GlxA family with amidase domain
MSKPGLNKAFKKILGRSVSEELRRRRMNHARDMLKGSAEKLYSIAAASGFKSEKHMRDTFIRETGMRPGQIRDADDEEDIIRL